MSAAGGVQVESSTLCELSNAGLFFSCGDTVVSICGAPSLLTTRKSVDTVDKNRTRTGTHQTVCCVLRAGVSLAPPRPCHVHMQAVSYTQSHPDEVSQAGSGCFVWQCVND